MKSKDRLCNRLQGSSRCLKKKKKGECPVLAGHCVSGLNLAVITSEKFESLLPKMRKELFFQ